MYFLRAHFITSLLDALVPPRKTERLVRTLTREQLIALARPDGTLPYHEAHIKALVWEVKYRKNQAARTLAGSYLAELILGVCAEELGTPLLIPVPMHPLRRKERGYNQTEYLCEAALQRLGSACAYEPRALSRVRLTLPQQKLPRTRRLKNMRGAMVADAALVHGRACLVVDDVATTGATLEEASRALYQAGARRVVRLTLAQS